MNIEESIEKLFSLQKFGIKLGLDNITGFLKRLGNPQNEFKSFHIAGSNGKGSTTSFVASILKEAGYKVGLYTSPHFVKFNERIKIGKDEIDDAYICDFVDKHYGYIQETKMTFFETTTALAFRYFADMKVDYGVIETGLGGRLDATNVIIPVASVITSISLEHTETLGDTLEKIAEEKAGIIKREGKVFVGKLPPEAMKVVSNKCRDMNSTIFRLKDFIHEENENVNLKVDGKRYLKILSPLKGKYQKYNSALAALCAVNSVSGIKDAAIQSGIKKVRENTKIQGRYEIFSKKPRIIFDSAHNLEGVENFLETFKEEAESYKNKILLFGAMRDKAIKAMLCLLKNSFDEIHFIEIDIERCEKTDELIKIGRELNINSVVEKEPLKFIKKFMEDRVDNCLVVLGSMYILGSIKSKI